MRLLVTGATGFTGTATVSLLLEKGFEVRCFARLSSQIDVLGSDRIEWIRGDVADVISLQKAMTDVDALVNIVSLGFGHAPSIIRAAKQARISRAIFISTTAVFTALNAQSKFTRLAAEDAISHSGLNYTILRPTMIYGSHRDRNMCRLIKLLTRSPIIPIFGNGNSLQQPVYVGDVAQAIMQSLQCERTIGHSYNISGKEPLTYNQVIDTIAQLLRRKVIRLYVPAHLVMAGLSALERLSLPLPIKSEQVARLNEDKAFDHDEASRDFKYQPHSFHAGMTLELQEMGLLA